MTDLSTFSPEYSNFIIINCVQVFATVFDYSDYSVDDVENLSTDNVEKWPLIAYSVDDVENLSTIIVDKLRGINLALNASTLLHPLSVSRKRLKIKLSTVNVDNLVEKCAEVA